MGTNICRNMFLWWKWHTRRPKEPMPAMDCGFDSHQEHHSPCRRPINVCNLICPGGAIFGRRAGLRHRFLRVRFPPGTPLYPSQADEIACRFCPDGGTGRRGGLKSRCRKTCGFESRSGHHHFGVSPSGKAWDFDSHIRWFESSYPSHLSV